MFYLQLLYLIIIIITIKILQTTIIIIIIITNEFWIPSNSRGAVHGRDALLHFLPGFIELLEGRAQYYRQQTQFLQCAGTQNPPTLTLAISLNSNPSHIPKF